MKYIGVMTYLVVPATQTVKREGSPSRGQVKESQDPPLTNTCVYVGMCTCIRLRQVRVGGMR